MVNLKGFTHKINESALGKNVSSSTIKRILKRFGFTWKRVRKSLKKLQDPILFAFFKQEIKELLALEKAGELDVFAFDESYIGLNPNSVYAWQSKESPYVLPAIRGESLSMLGFLKKDNTFQGYTINGACNTATFIAIMEDFMKTVTKKTVIIIDNAWASPLPSIKLLKYLKKSLFGNKIICFYSLSLLIVVNLIGLKPYGIISNIYG